MLVVVASRRTAVVLVVVESRLAAVELVVASELAVGAVEQPRAVSPLWALL